MTDHLGPRPLADSIGALAVCLGVAMLTPAVDAHPAVGAIAIVLAVIFAADLGRLLTWERR